MDRRGSLVCVGIGMTLGSHITPLARSYVETSDVVFAGLSDAIVELWLTRIRPDVHSFQSLSRGGNSGVDAYQQQVDAILTEVRAGKKVCCVFYGHPGVFTWASHEAIEIARREGYRAHMEPGVSAEDCLYADLGVDPGKYGCQHYETSQLMLYPRRLDTSAYLVLWQAGVAEDPALARLRPTAGYRRALVDVLARDYALEHEIIVYQAPTLPTHRARIDRVALGGLPRLDVDPHATLVIPPARALELDPQMRQRLAALDKTATQADLPTTRSVSLVERH
jgi:hypothetical protein